ncbi:MAG TPA: type II secretion system protein [Candidatus Paceibacterota bacterium]
MKKNGFTLMELLVVIAIIGILSSIVIASMTSARQKARDTKRISDIKQLQLALALFADANSNHYPATLSTCAQTTCLASTYIPAIPTPPTGGSYSYAALGSSSCTSYHLGALLEVAGSSVLLDDSDADAVNVCSDSAFDFTGTDPIFDVKP